MTITIKKFPRSESLALGIAAIALSLLAGCGSGGGSNPGAQADRVLAEAEIGPSGGRVEVASGNDAGVAIDVPAGAVAVATKFSILLDVANPEVPSVFPTYRFEPSAVDFAATPLQVTVRVGSFALENIVEAATDLTIFSRPGNTGPWQLRSTTAGPDDTTLTCTTARLGTFVPFNGDLHRLFTQDRTLLDPTVDTPTATLDGTSIVIGGGLGTLHVGRGSLQSFWSSPAAKNVLVVHGLASSPLDFLGTDDLVAKLAPGFDNVVMFSYPSGPGVVAAANALYDVVASNRAANFGCNIVAHSMGGLVARYLIEQSAGDKSRAGFRAGETAASSYVARLVMLGTPNGGAALANEILAELRPLIPSADLPFIQAGTDLAIGSALLAKLNNGFVNNPTVYHVIYGDLGEGDDGVVSVESALAVPLTAPESSTEFPAEHNALHFNSGALGVANRVNLLLQQ